MEHMKRCSTSLIREVQTKATDNHLTPVRTASINKTIASLARKGSLWNTAGGIVNWCSHYGKQCGSFSNTLPPNNSTSENLPEENNANLKRYMNSVYHTIIYNS